VDGDDVLAAAGECAAFLRLHVDDDWTARIPDLEWTVRDAVAHALLGSLWYTFDLSARGKRLDTLRPEVRDEAPPSELVDAFETTAQSLAYAVDGSPPGTRGYHPYGMADASGFAAMGCDEMLIHTDDAARGLGATFIPSDAIAERTVRRLFPWAPSGEDAWATLQWANGRRSLGEHTRLGPRWYWHCAPLAEWDGVTPRFVSSRG
jgi:uncharacterized protein (TIGR03083 family)